MAARSPSPRPSAGNLARSGQSEDRRDHERSRLPLTQAGGGYLNYRMRKAALNMGMIVLRDDFRGDGIITRADQPGLGPDRTWAGPAPPSPRPSQSRA